MKKTLVTVALLAGAVSGYSQGAIGFTGNTTGFKQAVFGYSATDNEVQVTYGGYTVSEQQGSSSSTGGFANETPAGTTVYHGGVLIGTTYSGELLGAAGSGDSLSELLPLLNVSSQPAVLAFQTGGAPSGTMQGSATVYVPGTTSGSPVATIAIAAWDNGGGQYTTLAAAQAANEPWGISALSTITTTFPTAGPALMSTASNLNLSFSLGESVPEPSTIALGVMGASALLFRRRK